MTGTEEKDAVVAGGSNSEKIEKGSLKEQGVQSEQDDTTSDQQDTDVDESLQNNKFSKGALVVEEEQLSEKNNSIADQVEKDEEQETNSFKEHRGKQQIHNQSTLYLGNLHPFVNDMVLQGVFAGMEGIHELKVIKDRATGMSAGYGFARFVSRSYAEEALNKVVGISLFGQQMKVNWALQREKEEELGSHHHIFVGDLSPEVTDSILMESFSSCSGCSDARVMWDHSTGRSRGYGFVSFSTKDEAKYAIETMDGAQIGSRCIRCGWAQHKTESSVPANPNALDHLDPTNTNVYVGNIPGNVPEPELRNHFGKFGTIMEMKLHRKGNFGFVRYKTHEEAVDAIVGLNSQVLSGRKLKCSWGRHPKVPPSGVKAQLLMAAVASGQGLPPQNPQGLGMPPMLTPQRPIGVPMNQPTTMFGNPGMEGDMEHPLIQGMSGMNLYRNPGSVPPLPQRPPNIAPPSMQLDPSQMYGMPPRAFPDSAGYGMPSPNQYGGLGNPYFEN